MFNSNKVTNTQSTIFCISKVELEFYFFIKIHKIGLLTLNNLTSFNLSVEVALTFMNEVKMSLKLKKL